MTDLVIALFVTTKHFCCCRARPVKDERGRAEEEAGTGGGDAVGE